MSASNVPITPGTGANVATDNISGNNYQVVKLDVGAIGTSTPVSGTVPVSQIADLAVSNSITSAGILITSSAGAYSYVTYQHTTPGVGCTCIFQASNDGTNWYPITLTPCGGNNPQPTSTVTTSGLFEGAMPFSYFQITCTQYGSGTISGIANFSVFTSVPSTIGTLEQDTSLTLRRLVKILGSNAVIDSSGRQRITVDNTPAVTVNSGTITTVSTVSSVTTVSAVTALTTMNQIANVDARYYLKDISRTAYGAAIRPKLVN